MTDRYEWDDEKALANERKHGISFALAVEVFGDPYAIILSDPRHSEDEDRLVAIGRSGAELILTVIHVHRHEAIRIVSARRATARERSLYDAG